MTGSPLLDTFLAVLLGGLISGGGILALGYRGLAHKLIGDLKEIFATKSEVQGLRSEMASAERALRVEIEDEEEHRVAADQHRDERVHTLVELMQTHINQMTALRDRVEVADRERDSQVRDIQEEVRVGMERLNNSLNGITGRLDQFDRRGS